MQFLCGDSISLADVVAYASVEGVTLPKNMKAWKQRVEAALT